MVRKKRRNPKNISAFLIIIVLIIGISLGFIFSDYVNYIKNDFEIAESKLDENYVLGEYEALIRVPALDSDGNGVSTELIVKVEEGTGKTLVDINTLLFWVDTQNSIRMAKIVAENITNIDLDKYDITYSINADASLIGGESAGSALTVATVAALENKKLRDDVMITGAINHDGSIGPIGGVLEKARAAKEVDANLFLVPLLQSQEVIYEERRHCEKYGFVEWCNTERYPVKKDIELEAGIDIVEVGSVREALNYFYEE